MTHKQLGVGFGPICRLSSGCTSPRTRVAPPLSSTVPGVQGHPTVCPHYAVSTVTRQFETLFLLQPHARCAASGFTCRLSNELGRIKERKKERKKERRMNYSSDGIKGVGGDIGIVKRDHCCSLSSLTTVCQSLPTLTNLYATLTPTYYPPHVSLSATSFVFRLVFNRSQR
jgi:hypothetical protein